MEDGSQGGVTSGRWGNGGRITGRGDRRVSHAQPKHRALYRQVPSLPFPEAAAETALLCWGQFNLLTTVLQCQCNGGGGRREAKRRAVQLVNYRVTMSQCQFNGEGARRRAVQLVKCSCKKEINVLCVCVCVGGVTSTYTFFMLQINVVRGEGGGGTADLFH